MEGDRGTRFTLYGGGCTLERGFFGSFRLRIFRVGWLAGCTFPFERFRFGYSRVAVGRVGEHISQ